MNIKIEKPNFLKNYTNTLVCPIFEKEPKLSKDLSELDIILDHKISALIKEKIISGKSKEINLIHGFGKLYAKKIIICGIGTKKDFTYEILRKTAGNIARQCEKINSTSLNFVFDELCLPGLDITLLSQAVTEGLILGGYQFDKYKNKKNDDVKTELSHITFSSNLKTDAVNKGIFIGKITAEAVNIARDLANTPPNDLNPKTFVEQAKKLLAKTSIKLEVLDKKKAKDLNMNAFLGVAQGSVNEPYVLVCRYQGSSAKDDLIALVGKGITFDSGGISIKPSDNMHDMKGDMSGAAIVLATMLAISQLKPKKNVLAVIPLAENMPSGSAQRPGDIVKAMNGKTIEIINTDAEGRLILADALCYAVKAKANKIIDIATLTGACSVALGDVASGLMGNNQKFIDEILKISELTGEKLWQLPMYEEYRDYLKSDIADMINCSNKRLAGTATAAKFLEEFVDKTPWLHIDIAGTSDTSETKGYEVKGQTAPCVRNLISYLISYK